MPVFVEDDERLLRGESFTVGFDYGIGLIGDTFIKFLSVLIVLVDAFGNVTRFAEGAGDKQLNGLHPRLHTARGIDARPDFKNQVVNSDFVLAHIADFHDGTKTEVGILVEPFQSIVGHNAIFAYHRHNVGRYADGNEVEHVFQIGHVKPVAVGESLHELETDATSRQVWARIARLRKFRV